MCNAFPYRTYEPEQVCNEMCIRLWRNSVFSPRNRAAVAMKWYAHWVQGSDLLNNNGQRICRACVHVTVYKGLHFFLLLKGQDPNQFVWRVTLRVGGAERENFVLSAVPIMRTIFELKKNCSILLETQLNAFFNQAKIIARSRSMRVS